MPYEPPERFQEAFSLWARYGSERLVIFTTIFRLLETFFGLRVV